MSREADGDLVEARGIDVSFGRRRERRQVLREVDLTLRPGEILGVIGESGSGKTTLARTLLGLVHPERGSVHVNGAEVSALRGSRLRSFRRRGVVQYVFQDPLKSLDPDRPLGDSIAEPLLIAGRRGRGPLRESVTDALRAVSLDSDIALRFPGDVSGGQRQRVAIARALITEPRVLILDEPVSALDAATRSGILHILRELADSGVAQMFISHDLGSVAGITDRTTVLYRGGVVESGSTQEIVLDPQHPYTRLLVGSAATLHRRGLDRTERQHLRELAESSA